jgi:hypothetical protein
MNLSEVVILVVLFRELGAVMSTLVLLALYITLYGPDPLKFFGVRMVFSFIVLLTVMYPVVSL